MAEPRRWRLFAHALDRTGPPMLVLAVVRWLGAHRPDDAVEVVAFRGGALEPDLAALVPVRVVLDPDEPWDHRAPDPDRFAALAERWSVLGPVDANLLVSASASQVLPLVIDLGGPLVTWSVEVGEDLHWLDDATGVCTRTDVWLAGSEATRSELVERLGGGAAPDLVPEFVEAHVAQAPAAVAAWRRAVGAADDEVLVVGAGIGTPRKGMDLFVEVAAACRRRGLDGLRFAWIGGDHDPLHRLVAAEIDRLALGSVCLVPAVADVSTPFEAADVLLHPARHDAFPLVALHAVLAGTPVVSFTDTGGMGELLGPGLRGAPYPDVEGLVDALVELLDGSARSALQAEQAAWVAPRFVADEAVAVLDAELRSVAARGGGR